jgi:hypothetical protein
VAENLSYIAPSPENSALVLHLTRGEDMPLIERPLLTHEFTGGSLAIVEYPQSTDNIFGGIELLLTVGSDVTSSYVGYPYPPTRGMELTIAAAVWDSDSLSRVALVVQTPEGIILEGAHGVAEVEAMPTASLGEITFGASGSAASRQWFHRFAMFDLTDVRNIPAVAPMRAFLRDALFVADSAETAAL